MRIISGKARGKKLKAPKNNDIRPTLDRVKESLFNIISPAIRDSVFLDLFCGSAAIGLEALSRGAKMVYFIDNNDESVKLAKENIHSCSFAKDNYSIKKMDALSFVTKSGSENIKFDVIYMDPPYGFQDLDILLKKISASDIMNTGSLLIAETDKDDEVPLDIEGLEFIDQRIYSITKLTFYERKKING